MAEPKIDAGFVRSGAAKITEADLKKVGDKADEIKGKAKGPLGRYLDDIKLLLSMVKDYATGNYREMPWFTIAAATFALLYILSPVDLIPDFVPVVGLADDAIVLALCLALVEEDLAKYKQWKAVSV